jgi:hypothetical protein
MLEASREYFRRAADALDLSPLLREILLTPFRVVKVELVIESDHGDCSTSSGIAFSTIAREVP